MIPTIIHNNSDIPQAYVTNKAIFCGLEFYIDQRVYVTNKETELMTEHCIRYILDNNLENGIIFDVGTGSGNIAIILAKRFPNAQIYAFDISQEALEVAAINVEKHHVSNVTLIHSDFVENIDINPNLIISDLPWGNLEYCLPTTPKNGLKYIPPLALFPTNGLIGSYIDLCYQIQKKQWKTKLFFEVGAIPINKIKEEMPKKKYWEFIMLHQESYLYAIIKVEF